MPDPGVPAGPGPWADIPSTRKKMLSLPLQSFCTLGVPGATGWQSWTHLGTSQERHQTRPSEGGGTEKGASHK